MFGTSKYKLYSIKGYHFLKRLSKEPQADNLVLLHGMFGGLSNFDPLMDWLSDSNVYVPSIPIYELEKSDLTIPGLSRWLHGFLSSLQIDDPILLGNSMGGHIALEYTSTHPFRVKALVLTGSSGLLEYDFGSSFPKRHSRQYIRDRANFTFYDDIADDEIVDEILAVVRDRKKLAKLLKLTRMTHLYNMEAQLPRIYQPVLLIWGRQDKVTPPKVAEAFSASLPNAQLKWIDRCGHAPMMERPRRFGRYLIEFLSQLKTSGHIKSNL